MLAVCQNRMRSTNSRRILDISQPYGPPPQPLTGMAFNNSRNVQNNRKYSKALCRAEELCLLGYFHGSINERYILGLRTLSLLKVSEKLIATIFRVTIP
jgi:hypothetical protein